MATAIVKVDIDDEAIAGLSSNECARFCTRRTWRPVFSWLDTWLLVGGFEIEVDFIWRRAFERRVWTMLIVPSDERMKLFAKLGSSVRNQDPSRAFVFQRLDQTFNNGDAPMFSSSAVSDSNALASTPTLESIAPEMRSLSHMMYLGLAPIRVIVRPRYVRIASNVGRFGKTANAMARREK